MRTTASCLIGLNGQAAQLSILLQLMPRSSQHNPWMASPSNSDEVRELSSIGGYRV